jgi:hypothetical protein
MIIDGITESEMKFEPELKANHLLATYFPGSSLGKSYRTDGLFKYNNCHLLIEAKRKDSSIQFPLDDTEVFGAVIQAMTYAIQNPIINLQLIVIVDWFNWRIFNFEDLYMQYYKFVGVDWTNAPCKSAKNNKDLLTHMKTNESITQTIFTWKEEYQIVDFIRGFLDKKDLIFSPANSTFLPFGKCFARYVLMAGEVSIRTMQILPGSLCSKLYEENLQSRHTVTNERNALYAAGQLVEYNDKFFKLVTLYENSYTYCYRLFTGNQSRNLGKEWFTLDKQTSLEKYYDLVDDKKVKRGLQEGKKLIKAMKKKECMKF